MEKMDKMRCSICGCRVRSIKLKTEVIRRQVAHRSGLSIDADHDLPTLINLLSYDLVKVRAKRHIIERLKQLLQGQQLCQKKKDVSRFFLRC